MNNAAFPGGVHFNATRYRPGQRQGHYESYDYFTWTFASEDREFRIGGEIFAAREDFVGLTYYNPPGGNKHCLNCKIAKCALQLTDKATGERTTLSTPHRAAFEILTSDADHGVTMFT